MNPTLVITFRAHLEIKKHKTDRLRTNVIGVLILVCASLSTLISNSAFAMTSCPAGFSELGRTITQLQCDYMGMINTPVPGIAPSATDEGSDLLDEAGLLCRNSRGTVTDGGSVGTSGVFLRCLIDFEPDEVVENQAEADAEAAAEEAAAEEAAAEEAAAAEAAAAEAAAAEAAAAEAAAAEAAAAEAAAAEAQEQLERNAPFEFNELDLLQGDPAELSVASSLVNLCSALRNEADPTAAQVDLLERCIDINRESSGSNQEIALGEIAAKQYSDIGQSLAFLNTIQVGNIGGRLAAITPTLRQNAKDVASSDFNHPSKGLLAASASNNNTRQTGGAAGDDSTGRFGVFLLATTGDGDKEASQLSNGFDYQSSSMTLGVDYMLNAATIIGLAYGEGDTQSDFTGGTGSMDIDSKTITLYGAMGLKNFFTIDAIIGVGDVATQSVRNMSFVANEVKVDQSANSQINSDQKLISIGISKGYERWLNIDLGARFNYIETDVGRFSENINPNVRGFGLALEIDDYSLKSSTTDLSVNVSKAFSTSWGVLIPEARLNWVHEFESGDRVLKGRFLADTSTFDFKESGVQLAGGSGSTLFNVPLEKLDADYGNFLVGLNALFANQLSVNASLNKTLGISDFDHLYWSLSARKDF